jgi:hypothetical protein
MSQLERGTVPVSPDSGPRPFSIDSTGMDPDPSNFSYQAVGDHISTV